ncbi:MAG: CRISPR-associated protein [Deltaproteobacteria bacterium]|nr:CRISPR-associated protein [Deltaproteobacteria bacterium]
MSYDLYVHLSGESQDDVRTVVRGKHRNGEIPDIAARIRILAGIAAYKEGIKEYAVSGDRKKGGGYKSLVHKKDQPKTTPYAMDLIAPYRDLMKKIGLLPTTPDLNVLPPGSWFLQFTFTLVKPWISKDDAPFYMTESVNPVRKDKVVKVPYMAAPSWKGLLRWTMMHIRLDLKKDTLTDEEFAQERFRQTLLFGDEKGEEPGQTQDFAGYLDALKPLARDTYIRLLRHRYNLKDNDPLPHHAGRLYFYPTFFDLIDVEVINPHSRKTKAGTHPIYLECVPTSAKGTFTMLYVPFDMIGQPEGEVKKQAAEDLRRVTDAVSAMMLTYGFSAKRTSGYGTAEDRISGSLSTTWTGKRPFNNAPFHQLVNLTKEVSGD